MLTSCCAAAAAAANWEATGGGGGSCGSGFQPGGARSRNLTNGRLLLACVKLLIKQAGRGIYIVPRVQLKTCKCFMELVKTV